MKQIQFSEINEYIGKGFKQETIKGSDGTRTYTVLSKKNDFRTRIKNFFTILVKILFSFGAALKDQKTRDKWHFALSKRTIVEVRSEKDGPKISEKLVKNKAPGDNFKDLYLKFETSSPTLSPRQLSVELSNQLLEKCSEEPVLSTAMKDAEVLNVDINIPPEKLKEILQSCPKLTFINFKSLAPSRKYFSEHVKNLLEFKEKQVDLKISINAKDFKEKDFLIFCLTLCEYPSFLDVLTSKTRNQFFDCFFQTFKTFNPETDEFSRQAFNKFSDVQIENLTISILCNSTEEETSIHRFDNFITLVDILNRNEKTIEILFKQKNVLTLIKQLFDKNNNLYSFEGRYVKTCAAEFLADLYRFSAYRMGTENFMAAVFSKLSDEQFESLMKLVFPNSEAKTITTLTKFLHFSVVNCNAGLVLKRISLVLNELDKKTAIPLIIESLGAKSEHKPPIAELYFYLVWNGIQQEKSDDLLIKTAVAKLSVFANPIQGILVFLSLLASACDPSDCQMILNVLNNYRGKNRTELISLFLAQMLIRDNNELIKEAFSFYWKNYSGLKGAEPPGTLALVLPEIKSVECLKVILQAIPETITDQYRNKICSVLMYGSHEKTYREYKSKLSEEQIDEAFNTVSKESKLYVCFKRLALQGNWMKK